MKVRFALRHVNIQYDTRFFFSAACTYNVMIHLYILQKVNLVTVTKGLYYCDNLGENRKEPPYLQNYIMLNFKYVLIIIRKKRN